MWVGLEAMKLLATYQSERAARKAVRALEAGGIDPSEIRIDAPQDDRDELRIEQQDEANPDETGPGEIPKVATKRAALGGTVVGIPVGGIIGLVIGLAIFRSHLFGVMACVVGFGVAGWIAMVLWSVYSAATEEQEATEKELTNQVIVGVHTGDSDEIARAEMILRSTEPDRLDRAS